jgi:hypothetical protein
MARMNWSRVQRGKSLKNPPRPELDSPISAKGRHPGPARLHRRRRRRRRTHRQRICYRRPADQSPVAAASRPRGLGGSALPSPAGAADGNYPSVNGVWDSRNAAASAFEGPPAPIHDQSSRRPAEPQGPDRRRRLAPTIHRALRGRPSTAPRRAPDSRRQGRDVAGVLHLRMGPPGLVSEEAECPALGRAAPLAG